MVKSDHPIVTVRPPTWHPGDILSDGDHVRADPVEEVVGQHQVDVSLGVCVESEVLLIVPRETLAQSPVQWRSHTSPVTSSGNFIPLSLSQLLRCP